MKSRMKVTKAVSWTILPYGCKSWSISLKSMDQLKGFEMKSYRQMLKITQREKKTNKFLWKKVTEALGERPESAAETIKRRTLKYYKY